MSQDSKMRAFLLNAILDALYLPPNKLFTQKINSLVQRNSYLFSNNQELFQFEGVVYNLSTATARRRNKDPLNKLHPSLRDELRETIGMREEMRKEKSLITGYIQKVLMASSDISDYEVLFPEALHKTLHGVPGFFDPPCRAMSPQFLAAFADANERYSNGIKLRLMTNFIEFT